jgi:L-alanine-DL-glutamate epimerase-like enolase superfamily enzyme
MTPICLAAVEAYAHRVPIREPIKVAFGTFRDRPFVLVRVVDRDGAEGWGEAWCNWPSVGAEHRARLVGALGERLIGREFASPAALFEALSRELEVLVLQTGEIGPIAQAVAGIDIAVWDMAARKRDLPLYRALGSDFVARVPVYATGINPDQPEVFASARLEEGHRAFKLKTGFGAELDRRNLVAMRERLGDGAKLMMDANQSLDLRGATELAADTASLGLLWFEEPMRIDAPAEQWQALARTSLIPLAGGENLRGDELMAAAEGKVLQVIQPDVTKWGGISGNHPVARATVERGKLFCPHVFGGGVALLAGLHILAAAGGEGLLEFDCHPNAGRELIVGDALPVSAGSVPVPQGPGIGVEPSLAALERYRTLAVSAG